MAVVTLLSAAVATGAGSSFSIVTPAGRENVPYVIRGITTATVKLEGSLDGTNWFDTDITAKTADVGGVVQAYPYMRANVTAWTSGTIYVEIDADQRFSAT